jgi:hypothetical protein
MENDVFSNFRIRRVFMKNTAKMTVTIVFAILIALTLISCGPPRLRGTVRIDGEPMVGLTLTANVKSLRGSGIISYQWLRDGTTVLADTNAYTLQFADEGSVITVTVIRSDNSGSVTSAPVSPWAYSIGYTGPGGGIVFYVDPNGFIMTDTGETAHYLEAAPADIPGHFVWVSSGFIHADILGTGAAIGTGRQNTALILAVDAEAPAALACRNYSNNGLTDWFLPSIDELGQLQRNRALVGNLGRELFWSSSQNYSDDAWVQSSVVDYPGYLDKNFARNVRAVRAF